MDNLMTLYGLGGLYRQQNPAERKVLISSKVAENAGLAKPLVYALMGSQMAEADAWDQAQVERLNTVMGTQANLAQQKADMDYAEKVMKNIYDVSKTDPEAATKILEIETTKGANPYLKKYEGIKFIAPSDKQWSFIQGGDGQQMAVSLIGLGWLTQHPETLKDENGNNISFMDAMAKRNYIIPLGNAKPDAAEKNPNEAALALRASQGDLEAKKALDLLTAGKIKVSEAGRQPKEEPRTTDQKELDQVNKERKLQGKTSLTLEEWKGIKADLIDPYGVKATVKEKLKPKQPLDARKPVTPQLNNPGTPRQKPLF